MLIIAVTLIVKTELGTAIKILSSEKLLVAKMHCTTHNILLKKKTHLHETPGYTGEFSDQTYFGLLTK